MERHGDKNKDEYLRQRLRYQKRQPTYVRRLNPTPRVGGGYELKSKPESQPRVFVNAVETIKPVKPVTPAPNRPSPVVQFENKITESEPRPEAITDNKSTRQRLKSHVLLYALAISLFATGSFASFLNFKSSHDINQTLNETVEASDGSVNDNSAPSTDKPSDQDISNYKVTAGLPKYIQIPNLDVKARILPMSVKLNGELKSPGNVYDAGWYNGSSMPGQNGAMLIDGHISSWTTEGVFYGLNTLQQSDEISIISGDDKVYTYKIVSVSTLPTEQVDMADLLVSADTSKPGLNLISCVGDVIPGTNEFDKRVLVKAVMID